MVSAIGLGCLSFGGMFVATDTATSHQALDAAWDRGITFYDTANIYGAGRSESVLGGWLAARGHAAVVATKVGIDTTPPRGFNNTAPYIRAELEASLRRLKTDHVALYYIHRRQQDIPVEDVAGNMSRLVHLAEWSGADTLTLTDADRATIDQLLPTGFAHGDRYDAAQNIGPERYA
jgi:aryl-alcohol dehydrogenase-like predicted oxidoreductase